MVPLAKFELITPACSQFKSWSSSSFANASKLALKPFLYLDAYQDSAAWILRSAPTVDASFAAIRARSKFGMAIAAKIKTNGITATPRYPSTKPATAMPWPPKRPADFRISASARCPRTIRGNRGRKHEKENSADEAGQRFPARFLRD